MTEEKNITAGELAEFCAKIADDKKAENAGCDDYITKPFKRKTIDDIIFKYLDN